MLLKTYIFVHFLLILSFKHTPIINSSKKIKLPSQISKSFHSKKYYKIYRSFITGQKRGIDKKIRKSFQSLQIMHLMTPSGLHFSTILFLLVLLRKKLNSKILLYSELLLCLIIYFFLPGYYSFRRVALLRALFIINKQSTNYNNKIIFSIFLCFDIFWGTYSENPMSFFYSSLFLGIIFLSNHKSIYQISLFFFIAQCFTAFAMEQHTNLMNIIFSPFMTYLFMGVYPLISINILFLDFVNYSQWIVEGYCELVIFLESISIQYFEVHSGFFIILGFIILTRKTILLSASLLIISFVI